MSNFKVGQKVVYIGGCLNEDMITPEINEIVTIACACTVYPNNYDVSLYYRDIYDRLQSFHKDCFRALDHAFADEVEAMIKEQLKEEHV